MNGTIEIEKYPVAADSQAITVGVMAQGFDVRAIGKFPQPCDGIPDADLPGFVQAPQLFRRLGPPLNLAYEPDYKLFISYRQTMREVAAFRSYHDFQEKHHVYCN